MKRRIEIIKTLTLCLLLSSFVVNLTGANQVTPNWMQTGTYVEYATDQIGYAYLKNDSLMTLGFCNATYGWQCVSVNNTTAKLKVTFNYVGRSINNVSLENATLQLVGYVNVDLLTRNVYDINGSLLGTTHMWVSANPAEGQDIPLWDAGSERVTLPAKANNIWFQSIQGKQKGFTLEGTATINGKPMNFLLLCDSDTGLMVDGSFEWDPIMAGAGINALLFNGRIILSDTNLALGPIYDPTDWTTIITITVLPITAFLLLFIAFYKHMGRKH